ncbi:ribose utilization transcriptional repressor RbsR [Furfurilactobacillus siliginis]|uniref:LacI family transcriptional regulator n=1 Tax=Furfurilactobacillus siliginis TaxID=348151 RepID=A0A0R2LA11_9LACO|nr:LacI family DNA-binding transcriptional regulator [Furfurilactobacillus siliginis]KRN96172.1 ribose operon repressor [Furfurilactobacillus siliginis]GEK27903.1 LacI family transcriptional regulator [Furfurilactobacillus siliginis]
MAKRITIKDVAKAADLSITTVSQILNGKGDRFPVATKEKVLQLRDQLGYVPNFNARNLISHSMKTVGVLIPNLVNPFFSMFLRGIQDAMYEHECVPIILSADRNEDLERYYLRTLVERGVDGVIIASSAIGKQELDGLLNRNDIPYLLFDQNDPINEGDRIIVDDERGGEMATNHLLDAGHTKIAVILPTQPSQNVRLRLAGYRSALAQRKLTFDDAMIFPTELSKQGGVDVVNNVIDSHATAVFCTNDELAIGLIRGLTNRGIRVPEDVSVVGYDDIDLDEYVTPRLTTVHQPVYEMGLWASQMIMKRLREPNLAPQLKVVDVELMKRNSVKVL